MARTLQTVAAFAAAGPFTQSPLRWWIFMSSENGLGACGAIIRVGRRIYIRGGSGKRDRGIGDGSALCGDHKAADERSREYETTPS